jgi:hypothetical protein
MQISTHHLYSFLSKLVHVSPVYYLAEYIYCTRWCLLNEDDACCSQKAVFSAIWWENTLYCKILAGNIQAHNLIANWGYMRQYFTLLGGKYNLVSSRAFKNHAGTTWISPPQEIGHPPPPLKWGRNFAPRVRIPWKYRPPFGNSPLI